MRRWHAERNLMLRRWRLEIAKHEYADYPFLAEAPLPPTADPDSCHCYRGAGYFRKRHPFDCGRPRCGVCHYEKFYEPSDRANVRRLAVEFELSL